MSSLDMEQLKSWIGRSESFEEEIAPQQIASLRALFNRGGPVAKGEPLRPMEHRVLFTPKAPQEEIGHDGHPKRGGFIPPIPLPRRMAAESAIEFRHDLTVGDPIRKTSEIHDLVPKEGRSGQLVFCTIRHRYFDSKDTLCIQEDQTVVYRDNPKPEEGGKKRQPDAAPTDHAWIAEFTPDPVMLFRYSACTYNGHRIHYDREYAMNQEGYPGLVVHGPLTASLLLYRAMEEQPDKRVAAFRYRAKSPLFDTRPFKVAGRYGAAPDTADLWSITPDGHMGTEGRLTWG